ncbi:Tryptophan--tRNA ligase, mitochondrial [Aspergillus hancockii]|nr:Tryptophan--tRNA ligase, mitochondrial [Aspergillus hancockii]
MRAAYYLKLPISGPVPLPRIVERWTFPRSNFVHKKSQENFERITLRRLIQIKDGNPQAVQTWLAFLRKHAFYGVDVIKDMDKALPEVEESLEPHLSQFGQRKGEGAQSSISAILDGMRLTKHRSPLTDDTYQLKKWRKESFATLLAVGLRPNRSTIFYQSAVPAHTELYWILSTVASMGYLSRMTQWKSKLQLPENTSLEHSAARSKLRLGLFSYPVLQAADILVHRATHVPVGEDQRQHLEFSRYTANSFNHLYGFVFPSPEALISPAKRVMSLREPTLKMSKSHSDNRSRITLTDSPEEIHKKVKVALTDSNANITYDPVRRPGVSNLIEILSHFDGRSCNELALEYESSNLRALKEHLADRISDYLKGIREHYFLLMDDNSGYLDTVAEQGAQAARANADVTMKQVREAMGL